MDIIPKSLKEFISKKSNREKIKEKCGSKAFLLPKSLKFPIMDIQCNIRCCLLYAAYVRAKEWHYNSIAKKAKQMYNKLKCSKKLKREIND